MEKKNILVLIVSAILVTGVSIAGCTQDSESSSHDGSSSSMVQTLATSSYNTDMKNNDQPAFNRSGEQNRTPPLGMMNGTPPSDKVPPEMNGTAPQGLPPGGMVNRTPPSGIPPSGA